MKKTTTLTLTALALSAAFTLNACGHAAASAATSVPAQEAAAPAPTALPTAAPAPLPAGTVLLSVNPEIEMEYDGGGNVMALNGLNDDGRAVLNAYSGYEGRPCAEVVGELVGQIDAGGYFDETIGGQEKNIVLRLESGSSAPAGFLNGLADAARSTVETRQIGSQTMTLDGDDMDDAYAAQGYISAGAAEQLLAAQLARDDLQFVERDYDLEDGDYEIAFVADGIEYEFEVDARTGKVTEMEAEGRESWEDHWDDDWDDQDDDWEDQHDDWDDQYDDLDDQYDDLDDQYDDWDDQYDDWDDRYDDWDDQYDDWDDQDDDWDDQYDDWDDQDDDWDDQDDDWDDQDDDWDDQDDDWDDQDDDWDDDDDDWDDDDDGDDD